MKIFEHGPSLVANMSIRCTLCPCGERSSPDPNCDMCDGFRSQADTGWGGFTDGFLGQHFDSEEQRQRYIELYKDDESDEDVTI